MILNFECECGGLIINGKDSHCWDCIIGEHTEGMICLSDKCSICWGEEE